MKTKEELKQIKNEYTELNKKLAELTEEELSEVAAGFDYTKILPNLSPSLHKVDPDSDPVTANIP